MHAGYEDILELGAKPLWWDENGVPRFKAHAPSLSANIYAIEVVLLKIACQLCGVEQLVQMTWSSMDTVNAMIRMEWARSKSTKTKVGNLPRNIGTLADAVRSGSIHYGDPPYHDGPDGEFCHAGCTMNCYDLAVVEFWKQGDRFEWNRVPELEVALPDAKAER